MLPYLLRSSLLSGGLLLNLLVPPIASAEVVPDTTLPNNSRVDRQGEVRVIEGGTQRGGSLFHSFQEFSLPTGGTAYFNNDGAIENIFTRVTGSNRSEIDGVIRANGTANLFLLNPNGILFGANASLNIGGSFLATTADSILFADGTQFSAAFPQSSSLLTVSVPIGLQFGQNPGTIQNLSISNLNVDENGILRGGGLQVADGRTLSVVGGNLVLDGGILSAPDGRIELGSVDSGSLVSLSDVETSFTLDYANVRNFRNIQLSNGAAVTTTGQAGGGIQIQGQDITLTDESAIVASTLGSGNGSLLEINARRMAVDRGAYVETSTYSAGSAGDLIIRASEQVELAGISSDQNYASGVVSQVYEGATGRGGELTVDTGKLVIRGGAAANTATDGAGQAGGVIIRATNGIELLGSGAGFPSFLGSEVRETATGNGGDLTLRTNSLQIEDGAILDNSTLGQGNAGNIDVQAFDLIRVTGESTGGASSIGALVGTDAVDDAGNAGSITLRTERLEVTGGAQVGTVARTGGQGGSLIINANSVLLRGRSTIDLSEAGRSGLFVSAELGATENAGELFLTARELRIEDGARLSADNFGTADRGGIATLNVQRISLNSGEIKATTESGIGGIINLQNVEQLLMENQSFITAEARNNANGGNITIDAPNGFIIAAASQDNDIVANAFSGRGGNIQLTAEGIVGLEERRAFPENGTNDIDASSEFGAPGSVIINTPEVDPSQGLVALPGTIVDASRLIAQTCPTENNNVADNSLSEFVITGRGGLPPSPSDPQQVNIVQTEWVTLPTQSSSSSNVSQSPARTVTSSSIVEAQGWFVRGNGEIMLIAQAPSVTPDTSFRSILTCTSD